MKTIIRLTAFAAVVIFTFTSCGTIIESGGSQIWDDVIPEITAYNDFKYDIADEPIMFTIDISTAEGRVRLRNKKENQVKRTLLVDAVMYNKCASLFKPQFSILKKGRKILRATIYGFPAKYKATE